MEKADFHSFLSGFTFSLWFFFSLSQPMNCLLLAFTILLQINGFQGCIKEERRGLLEIKTYFRLMNGEADNSLLSWIHGKESNCCNWVRVTCDRTTGRVIELDLNNLRILKPLDLPYFLNVSLFSPFKELRILDLSGNKLWSSASTGGFIKLVHLKRLEKLNLAFNELNNSIFKSLGALKPLKFLNLSDNNFEGLLPVQDLSALWNLEILDLSHNWFEVNLSLQDTASLSQLIKLEHLDLSHNNFDKHILKSVSNLKALIFLSLQDNYMDGPISSNELDSLNKNLEVLILRRNCLTGPLPIQDLISFKNLKVLDLSKNNFKGSVPQIIGLMSSLSALSLAENNLTGFLPSKGFCELKGLQELDLSQNAFEGPLPHCFTNLSSIKVLDLSMNQFKGDISFIISNFTSLQYMSLKDNEFEGKLSLSLLANHSELEIIELGNMGKIDVETENSNWTPNFQLKVLQLSNCNLNKLRGNIPTFLSHQYRLKVVDLSHNNLRGNFPNWLLQKNAGLEVLNLRNNSLVGQLSLPPHQNNSICWYDLSNNHLTGQVGEDMGRKLPSIEYLNLSRNYFDGTIPSSFCNMSNLGQLDLSFNFFYGEIPKELIAGCIDLYALKVSNNKFEGEILATTFNLTNINYLSLEDNHFSGTVSNVIARSSFMRMLDISNNNISGEVSWISNMTQLSTVLMYNNFLRGRLPCQLGKTYFLDISHNSLSGPLPSCSNNLGYIVLQGNKFTGPIPYAFLNSSYLLTLDMRDNLLSGTIPNSLQALSNLRVLLLGSNQLNGSIPNHICNLNKVSLMDLSHNKFSGIIPRCINNISFGKFGMYDQIYILTNFYFEVEKSTTCTYGNFLVRIHDYANVAEYTKLVEVEFVTKGRPRSYVGNIINYMSGLDLSCNNLTGEIPHEIGDLGSLHAANLSHNHLKGSIPKIFSHLSQIESLDLSYNRLSGEIPPELLNLHFLEVFSVAYNNLSGKTPEIKAQFGTFDRSSYEGNLYLCGLPLENKCSSIGESPKSSSSSEVKDTKWLGNSRFRFRP
ncbi:LRR receptor-like serine/threonine-protein kinase GSO2 isoform X2 [Olea europaea var. sylvestris]|uniref:LRR receptor-like serine/threonine-protein kinase GSO2 isoform X2 n=1 Tax=Olea europaea var. sylvestris TaxID=158386 RepID=UPI000C1D0117|nr:LRR receptor-like serine/threonine-protein kinase GSO2 isoform X2 [Olea europaea var. sylvestris]